MKRKKKRLSQFLAIFMAVAMMISMPGTSALRVHAASNPIDESIELPFGEVINYDEGVGAITAVWGRGASELYCITVSGKDTTQPYSAVYDDKECGFYSFPCETGSYEKGKTYTVEIQGKVDGKYSKAVTKDVTIPGEISDGEGESGTGEGEGGTGQGGEDEVNAPSMPVGLVANYWSTEDANKGKIWICWGADFGTGGTPTQWEVSIDNQVVATENGVAAYFYENTYDVGEHTVSLVAINEAGRSEAATANFTLTEEQKGNVQEPEADVKAPSMPSGLVANYWSTEDANKGKIWVCWGAGFGDGGTPTQWEVSIDNQVVATENGVAAYFYENTYAAGEHTVSLVAINEAGRSEAATTNFTLSEEQAGEGESQQPSEVPSYTRVGNNLCTNVIGTRETWVEGANSTITNYQDNSFTFDIKGYEGYEAYHNRVEQAGLNLTVGKNYAFTFDITSSKDKKTALHMDLPDAGYAQIAHHDYELKANERTTVTFFTGVLENDLSAARVMIQLGMIVNDDSYKAAEHFITVQNVSMYEIAENVEQHLYAEKSVNTNGLVAEEEEPVPVAADVVAVSENLVNNEIGKDMTLSFAENADFAAAITAVTVNGNQLAAEKYNVTNSSIVIDSSVFTTAGVYEVKISAGDYKVADVHQVVYENDDWNLIWNDEFSGNSLDMTKWDYQTGNGSAYGVGGWGNSEEEYYTDSAENSSVANGTLTITAKKDSKYGSNYTSARLRTVTEELDENGKAKTGTALQVGTYGRVEAKIKMPVGDGIWPAFWMLPFDSEYGTWASSGEIDIMEARGRLPQSVCGTIHYGDVWPNNANNGNDYHFTGDESIADYHTYSIEWEPTEMRWYVDGELYSTLNNWYSVAGEEGNYPYPAPFDEEFYVLLNLAVGGTFDSAVSSDKIQVGADGVAMDVDYVRWYQKDASVYENWDIVEPDVEKDNSQTAQELLATADANGNFLQDGDFAQATTTPNTTGNFDVVRGNWVPLLVAANGNGAATWSKVSNDGDNFMKVAVTNAGSQTYSVQMLQHFAAVKGYDYEISYTAYTDNVAAKPDVSLKIGGDNDNGWAVYGGPFAAELTTTPTTYTHKFTMLGETDPTARLEFNLATSTGNVYLSDVSIKLTTISEADGEDDAKEPLSDGNHIYNGKFNIGSDRLKYWHWDNNDATDLVKTQKVSDAKYAANVSVTDAPVSLWQKGVNLLQNDTYKISFDVNSSEAGMMTLALLSEDGSNTYFNKQVALNAGANAVEESFTQQEGQTDENAKLMLTFSKDAALSNVKMIRTTNRNVNFDEMNIWPMNNGDFFNGKTGWNIWNEGAGWQTATVNDAGKLQMQVAVGADATFYCVGVQSPSMKLDKGIEYRVKFDYEIPSDKNYTLELAGEQREITLKAGAHTYVSEPFIGAGACTFTLYLGPDQTEAYAFFLDNVEVYVNPDFIEVPAGYDKPVSVAQAEQAKAGSTVNVKFTEDDAWENADKTYYIDGKEIDSSLVTLNKAANTLQIAGSCFPEAGSYSLSIKADGYTMTVPTGLTILDKSGNLLLNSDFAAGTDNWAFYFADWTAGASFTVNEEGVAVINHAYDGGEEWHLQLFQEGLNYDAGTYVISFDAWADVERPIGVQLQNGNDIIGGSAQKVVVGTERKNYKFVLENLAAGSGMKLDFPMGSITFDGVSTPNDGNSPYNIYMDNVVFRAITADDYDAIPATISSLGSVKVGEDVTVSYTDASERWSDASKTVMVNGTAIDESKIKSETNAGLVIDGSVFTVSGKYKIFIEAAGYDATNVLKKNVTRNDGNQILNGGLNTADYWTIWDEDATGLSKGELADGVYTLDYKAGYYRDDWSVWVTWSSQLIQEGISVEAGKTYVLSFDATTDLEGGRSFIIETSCGTPTVTVAKGAGTYQVEFTPTATTDEFAIKFLLGPVGDNLQGDNPEVPHKLILDNISFRDKELPECTHENTEIRNKVEASCAAEGCTGDKHCVDCDRMLEAGNVIEKLAHNYENEVTKEPTTTEEGEKTFTCTECGHSYTESIDKLPVVEDETGEGDKTDDSDKSEDTDNAGEGDKTDDTNNAGSNDNTTNNSSSNNSNNSSNNNSSNNSNNSNNNNTNNDSNDVVVGGNVNTENTGTTSNATSASNLVAGQSNNNGEEEVSEDNAAEDNLAEDGSVMDEKEPVTEKIPEEEVPKAETFSNDTEALGAENTNNTTIIIFILLGVLLASGVVAYLVFRKKESLED